MDVRWMPSRFVSARTGWPCAPRCTAANRQCPTDPGRPSLRRRSLLHCFRLGDRCVVNLFRTAPDASEGRLVMAGLTMAVLIALGLFGLVGGGGITAVGPGGGLPTIRLFALRSEEHTSGLPSPDHLLCR